MWINPYIAQRSALFFPLLVRPNTILPLGKRRDRPDYDYAEEITFLLTPFADGAALEIEIPDLNGKTVMRVSAKRLGNSLTLTVAGGQSWDWRPIGFTGALLTRTENSVELSITQLL